MMHFDQLRAKRYGEFFLIAGNPLTKNFTAGVYNCVGLNHTDGTGDCITPAMADKMDTEALAKEYGAFRAYKNAPRLFALDWIDIKVGKERDFAGTKMRWVMWLDVPKELMSKEVMSYKRITGKRDTNFGFNKGKPVFLLDDPEGVTWVMKSVSLLKDPSLTYESLATLGQQLKVPAGWKFRTTVLDKDLVLTPNNGQAMILLDDRGNVYDRTDGAYSNFKP